MADLKTLRMFKLNKGLTYFFKTKEFLWITKIKTPVGKWSKAIKTL